MSPEFLCPDFRVGIRHRTHDRDWCILNTMESLYFYLSKVLWNVFQPGNLLLILLALFQLL